MLQIQSWELSAARTEMEQLFTDSATIKRFTGESDGQGGETPTPQEFTGIPCRVVDLRVNRPLEFEQPDTITSVMAYQILFAYGTDVRPRDTIIVNSVEYEVIQDNGVRTDGLLTLVACNRLDQ